MLDDDTRKTKNRMPQLFINDLRNKKTLIKTWWRQLKRSKTNDKDDTTLDWRSLSPDKPPLPFLIPDKSATSVHNDISVDKKTISSMPTLLTDTTLIDPADIESLTSTSSNSNSNVKPSNSRSHTIDNYQPLYPILEESETMATESNESNVLLNSDSQMQRQNSSPSQAADASLSTQLDITDNKQAVSSSSAAVPSIQEPTTDEQQPDTSICPLPPIASSSSSVKTETNTPWPEIKAIQKTPSDQFMPFDLVGNEDLCKRKFAKMVLAANKFQQQQQQQIQVQKTQNGNPSEMALLFDDSGNIDMMRMVRQGKSEYHKFCGNSQYVPPELSVNIEYHSELADVWVLGVFLYRMLVGRYPFSASNDQQLFKKMLNSDFSIPNELSEDAKDIIKRMLAPDSSRASLDLIIHHPWLKPYRPLLLDRYHYHHTVNTGGTMKANRPIYVHGSSNSTRSTITKRLPISSTKQRNILSGRAIRRSNSVNTTTPSTASSATNEPKHKKKKHNTKNKGFIKKAFSLLLQGPFPPPKKPYQALAHLGTRESVFAKHKT